MEKNKILELPQRRIIFNYISEHPGLHLRELSRRIDIPYSSIRYHLYYQEKRSRINCECVFRRQTP